ncbi:MAG: HutP family protein [Eubacteriales bacterium]|nr:HutP family protein [Eubacteriales bacterium]MDD4389648.1 HutP family protein [Eubacteriales bacterium]
MLDSVDVARAAVSLSITATRAEEEELIKKLSEQGIIAAAVDIGGDIISKTHIVIERAVIAARKSKMIKEDSISDGVIAGAAREAQSQIVKRAIGLNGGGKIAVCRSDQNVCVSIFMSIGMMYLNEVAIGLGHRVVGE